MTFILRRTPAHRFMVAHVLIALMLTASAFASASAQTTIDVWYGESSPQYIKSMAQMVEQFEAEHPDIRVNLVLKGAATNYKEELLTVIVGGVPPDVAYVDSFDVFDWILHGSVLHPLNPLLSEGEIANFASDYLVGPRTDVSRNGIWYAVPVRTATRGMFLNVDLFEQAGMDGRKGPETIAELDAFAAKLTRMSGANEVEILGFAPNGNNWANELPWIWAFGGEFFDYDNGELSFTGNPRNLAAVEWIQSYAERYGPKVVSSPANFRNQKVAMHINSTTSLTNFPDRNPELNWWTAQVPSVEGVSRVSFGASPAYAIPLGAPHPMAAATFAAYFSRPEVQVALYEATSALPATSEALRQIIPMIHDPRERILVEVLPVTRKVPLLYSQLRLVWQDNLDEMRMFKLTPDAVLEATQRVMEPLYREVLGGGE